MKTIEKYNKICNKIIKKFEKKQDLKFEFWIDDEVGDIASFGTYFFNFKDIVLDLIKNQPKYKIIEWYEYIYDCKMKNDKEYLISYTDFILKN